MFSSDSLQLVAIADDQALVRAGLASLVDAEPGLEVIGVAADGLEALAMARERAPDVACLDIRMPGLDGIEVTRHLCGPGVQKPIPVLVLTTFDLDERRLRCAGAGASGFLLKDADPTAIVHAVRQVAAGYGTFDQSLTSVSSSDAGACSRRPPAEPGRSSLRASARSCSCWPRGMSNDDLAAELTVEVSTVKSHLARLLPKLGVRSPLQAVVWAYQSGLVSVGEP